MSRKWGDVRQAAVREGYLDESRVGEHKGRMLAAVRAHKLAEVRTSHGLNQEEMAERLHISQSRVSRIERGQLDQSQISTLRAYVEALGGELEVSARFGDDRITLGRIRLLPKAYRPGGRRRRAP